MLSPISSEQRRGSFITVSFKTYATLFGLGVYQVFFFSWSSRSIGFGAVAYMRHLNGNEREGKRPSLHDRKQSRDWYGPKGTS